jgi:triacylglycerol esterase/lipase EstA (alpha/beta hydrolase family)
MAEIPQFLRVAGRSVAVAATWVSGQAVGAYRSIDPDVPRHLAQVPLLAYAFLVPREAPITVGKSDGHAPLVFVHGLGAQRGCFLPMAGYLWLRGRRRRYSIDLSRGRTVEAMARRLARYVDRVVAKTGEPQVDLIAHSLGGVVARLALADHGLAPKVRTLITLGSPHHGTWAARYGASAAARALRPDSPLMRRLARSPLPDGVRAVSFWSKSDVFILPAESAVLEGAAAVEVTPFTHYSYLLLPQSWTQVADALEPRTLGPLAERPSADRFGSSPHPATPLRASSTETH